ncbi:orotate phosphoribosyltransferase [Bacillus shivajii]|uniref:orotate phosphoribosyltransferase n=1 Tax=Bacillus shivajii TaxID=1983719 RepID=UPI001CFC39BE|nr:orotate phosphoribosyltransferase [Bacillus shivajii]UCZ51794.1 orotate phosphoribosyltransferase [Bacillus shivajii]
MNKNIADLLLKIKAVSLSPNEPYTWSSGIKSPIYCDNRLVMSYPEERGAIIDAFVNLIKEKFPETEVIAGTATAGIPHAAWISDRLNLPMVYIRSKAKGHGKENLIEGTFKEGQRILVIEDLISTGGSSLQAADAVKASGGIVTGVCSIFTYELPKASDAFQQKQVPYYSLTTFSKLLNVALSNHSISEQEYLLLEKWRQDPENWLSSQ